LLLKLGRTRERLSLRGSVARRRAQCLPPGQADALTEALKTARDAYHEAVELHRETTGAIDSYPALNEVVLGWLVAQRCGSAFDVPPRVGAGRAVPRRGAGPPLPGFLVPGHTGRR
jgi:hypothetical protein